MRRLVDLTVAKPLYCMCFTSISNGFVTHIFACNCSSYPMTVDFTIHESDRYIAHSEIDNGLKKLDAGDNVISNEYIQRR